MSLRKRWGADRFLLSYHGKPFRAATKGTLTSVEYLEGHSDVLELPHGTRAGRTRRKCVAVVIVVPRLLRRSRFAAGFRKPKPRQQGAYPSGVRNKQQK